ncbi:MAG: pyridoxal phosphate-dependent aminotransferase [Spirochaetales bacterium]|nr:pyridoxal phosphate-dependent aminotransferase [Spirochaetales bacterium]
MKYNFDKVISRSETHSVKWEFMPEVEGKTKEDLLPLWIADMDFPCAEPIIKALHERVDRQIFGYSLTGSDKYLSAVQGWFKNNFNWEFNFEDIQIAPGVVPALTVLIKSLTKPGDGIIIQKPVYYPFMAVIESNGRRNINNALIEKDGYYSINFKDLEEKASEAETSMMVLCSPHNPVGRVWTKDELTEIARICLENDVILVSDEIHCDLIRKESNFIPMGCINSDERIISCTSASKSFNLAGMQISNIIIKSEKYRKLWNKEIFENSALFGSNPLGIVATEAAYTRGFPWLKQVNQYIDANLCYVKNFLEENLPELGYRIPEGTYFAWIDLRRYGFSAEQLEDIMRKKAGVLLDEGYIFGEEGIGFERINVACPRSILHDCLIRMKKAIRENMTEK